MSEPPDRRGPPPAGDLPLPGVPPLAGLQGRPAGASTAGPAPAAAGGDWLPPPGAGLPPGAVQPGTVQPGAVASGRAQASRAEAEPALRQDPARGEPAWGEPARGEPARVAAEGDDPARGDVVIRVRNLVNRFGSQVVHDDLNLDLYRGEVLGVVGGSGTGKSVLLRTIVGLNRPQAGRIEVFGQDVLSLPVAERRKLEARWGVAFQDGALFSSLTVAQNVEVPLREHLRLPQRLMDEIAAMKISMVGLAPEAGAKFPSELSGGMRKRAALARALAMDPEIVFLDEPTAGLDPIGAAAYDSLIKQLQENLGLTVFMVTHDLDSLHAICDRIAVLAEKRVLVTGTMEDMMEQDHPWIREYFHGPRARAAMHDIAARSGSPPPAAPTA